ncbi:MAG: hypothetical protein F6K31_31100, partial [Symploca sp. SIO2G7]|nr:hypothetical protein [Symploca sp. SIO2G7]
SGSQWRSAQAAAQGNRLECRISDRGSKKTASDPSGLAIALLDLRSHFWASDRNFKRNPISRIPGHDRNDCNKN